MAKRIEDMTQVELDDLACKLSRDLDWLEMGYRDHNGEWIDAKSQRQARLLKGKLAAVDAVLALICTDGE